MDVFVKSILTDRVRLSPEDVTTEFKEKVSSIIRSRVEGKCSRHGYIKPSSTEVLKISPGSLRMFSLNGDVIYTVVFKALVCNPVIGSVVSARVTNTNKFGILAEVTLMSDDGVRHTVMEIIVAKQGAIRSEVDMTRVQLNDVVNIEILGKKFELNDKRISAIGRIVTSGVVGGAPDVEEVETASEDNNEESDVDGTEDASDLDEDGQGEEVEPEVENEADVDVVDAEIDIEVDDDANVDESVYEENSNVSDFEVTEDDYGDEEEAADGGDERDMDENSVYSE